MTTIKTGTVVFDTFFFSDFRFDTLGRGISGSGDINGDGFNDLVIAGDLDTFVENGDGSRTFQLGAGTAFVLFGSSDGLSARVDLADDTTWDGFRIDGMGSDGVGDGYVNNPAALTFGDGNGDGIDDLFIGLPGADGTTGSSFGGRAEILFGQTGNYADVIRLGSASAPDGFTITNETLTDGVGMTFEDIGDIDGDGITNIAISASQSVRGLLGPEGATAGITLVFNGMPDPDMLGRSFEFYELSRGPADPGPTTEPYVPATGTATDGTYYYGAAGSRSGQDLTGLGDFSGDGIDDFAIADENNDTVYLIQGGTAATTQNVIIGLESGTEGITRIIGPETSFGHLISGVGDTDGDGLPDLLVTTNPGIINENAEAYLIYGTQVLGSETDLTDPATGGFTKLTGFPSRFTFRGQNEVLSVGDVNGDGLDDILITSVDERASDIGGPEDTRGVAWLVFGQTGGLGASFDVSTLDGTNGYRLGTSSTVGTGGVAVAFGYAAAGLGDMNGDGFDDFAVSAPFYRPEARSGGATFVYHGGVALELLDAADGEQDGYISSAFVGAEIDVNTAPDAVDDVANSVNAALVPIDLLGNDSDVDGDTLTVVSVAGQALSAGNRIEIRSNDDLEMGFLTFNADGTGIFEPTYIPILLDLTRTATVLIGVSDGTEESSSTLTLTLSSNAAPIAANDDYTDLTIRPADVAVFDVLENDGDPDGGRPSLVSVGTPNAGTAEVTPSGTIRYTAPAQSAGEAVTFIYTIEDSQGLQSTGTVSLNISNAAPIANGGGLELFESGLTEFNPLDTDSDPDGDAFSVNDFELLGNWSDVFVDWDLGVFRIAPFGDNPSVGTLQYTLIDEYGAVSAPGIYSFTLNERAVAVDDRYIAPDSSPFIFDPTLNDYDPEGDSFSVSSFDDPIPGVGALDFVQGGLVFTPDPGFVGTASFDYRISGDATATIQIDVPSGQAVANDDSYTVARGETLIFDPLENDTDPFGAAFALETFPTVSELQRASPGSNQLEFTPGNFFGEFQFTYTITGGAEGTVTITVPDDRPVPVADSIIARPGEDFDLYTSLIANDTFDPARTLYLYTADQVFSAPFIDNTPDALELGGLYALSYQLGTLQDLALANQLSDFVDLSIVFNTLPVAADDAFFALSSQTSTFDLLSNDSDADNDILTLQNVQAVGGANGVFTFDADAGELTFTPANDFNGIQAFSYTISDGLETATASARITVGDNVPGQANDDAYAVSRGIPFVFDPLVNDTDAEGDPVVFGAFNTTSITGVGRIEGPVAGEFTFLPDSDFVGLAEFAYTLADGDRATVTFDVRDTPPIAVSDVIIARPGEDIDLFTSLLANDLFDTERPIFLYAPQQQGNFGVELAEVSAPGQYVLNSPDTIDLTGIVYALSYESGDPQELLAAGKLSNFGDADIYFKFPPMAVDDTGTVRGGQLGIFDLLTNDSDPNGDGLTLEAVTPVGALNGIFDFNPNSGVLNYSPLSGTTGLQSFDYTISDGLDTATGRIGVTITADQAPFAVDDVYVVRQGAGFDFDPTENDTDAEDDDISVVSFSGAQPGVGRLVAGTTTPLTFVPEADFLGQARFSYSVNGGSAATITFDVQETPTPVADTVFSLPGERVDVFSALIGNDIFDSDRIVEMFVTGAIGSLKGPGALTINSTGAATIERTYSLAYEGGPRSETVTSSIVFNTPPDVTNERRTGAPGEEQQINVLDNDSDADGDRLLLDGLRLLGNGKSAWFNSFTDGTIVLNPPDDFRGQLDIEYSVTDGKQSQTGVASFTVTTPPVAADDLFFVPADITTRLDVLENDDAPDGASLFVLPDALSLPENGRIISDALLLGLNYTPDDGFLGLDQFGYTVSAAGLSSAAGVTVIVDSAPVAADQRFIIGAGESVDFNLFDTVFDPDGPAPTIQFFSGPGSVLNRDTGSFSFTAPDDTASQVITYSYYLQSRPVFDGVEYRNPDLTRGTIEIEVVATPDAVSDIIVVSPGETINYDIIANDTANSSYGIEPLSFENRFGRAEVDPQTATRVIDVNGFDFVETYFLDTVSVTGLNRGLSVTDYTAGNAFASDDARLFIVVDTPPEAQDDVFYVQEGTVLNGQTLTFDVLANDTDADLDNLTARRIDGDPGTTLSSDGTLSVRVPFDFGGQTSVTYVARSSTNLDELNNTNPFYVASEEATATVIFNNAPNLTDDNYTIRPGETLRANVLDNDSDPDGDLLSVFRAVGVENGTLSLFGNGALTYTPDAGFVGSETITYTVDDGAFGQSVAEVTIEVVNSAPVVSGDGYSITQGEELFVSYGELMSNDFDADGDAFEYLSATTRFGSLREGTTGLLYTPDPGLFGLGGFEYRIIDEFGAVSDFGVVDVDILEPQSYFLGPDVSEPEGDSGTTPATFTVNRLYPGEEAWVYLTVVPGYSVTNADLAMSGDRLVYFAADATQVEVDAIFRGDTLFEADETVTVTIDRVENTNAAPVEGIVIDANPLILTIENDDPVTYGFASSTLSAAEGGIFSNGFVDVTATRDVAVGAADVSFTATFGGAAQAQDLISDIDSFQVSFADGASTATGRIFFRGDSTFEEDETLTLTIADVNTGPNAPTAAVAIAPGNLSVTIENDDPATFGAVTEVETHVTTDLSEAIEGEADELDGDSVTNLDTGDTIVFQSTSFGVSNLRIFSGSAILQIDEDGDGTTDTELRLLGDYEGSHFFLEQTGPDTTFFLTRPGDVNVIDQAEFAERAFATDDADIFVFGSLSEDGDAARYQIQDFDPANDTLALLEGTELLSIQDTAEGALLSFGTDADTALIAGVSESQLRVVQKDLGLDADLSPRLGNLIINGDFEDHGALTRGGFLRSWDLFEEITGWTSPVGDIEIQDGPYGTPNPRGNSVLELDARFNSTIAQTVTIDADGLYSIGLDFAKRGASKSNGLEIWVNGERIADLDTTVRGFQSFESRIALSEGEALIEIKGAGRSDSIGTVIDNVTLERVVEAPENLILNGDFEAPVELSRGRGDRLWDLFNTIDGWQASDGLAEVQKGAHGTVNTVDNAVVELDASRNSTISQTIFIDEADTFEFSIDFAQRGIQATNGFDVFLDDVQILAVSETSRDFQTLTERVELSTGEVLLEIKGSGRSDSIGTIIDNVSLIQVDDFLI